MKETIIAIDFDGTIVEHEFPDIGSPVPGAFQWMKKFQEAGAKLILYTMRSNEQNKGDVLTEAIDFCRNNGVEFWGINTNPEQDKWTTSPKAWANIYIDDCMACCPLEFPPVGNKPYVNWDIVGPWVMERIEERKNGW